MVVCFYLDFYLMKIYGCDGPYKWGIFYGHKPIIYLVARNGRHKEMAEEESLMEDQRRDQLLVDALLRVYSLEKLLISKNVLSEEEIAKSYIEAVKQLKGVMETALGKNFDGKEED